MNPLDAPITEGIIPVVSPWPTILKYGLIGSGVLIAINTLSFFMIDLSAAMSSVISSALFSLLILMALIISAVMKKDLPFHSRSN